MDELQLESTSFKIESKIKQIVRVDAGTNCAHGNVI
jgi:hypothetical protein